MNPRKKLFFKIVVYISLAALLVTALAPALSGLG